ncbi:MAG: hypothetical protein K2Q32_07880 [Alphaproteobacteria bacterium]|nr:hypothetical protein [Alphaproteobacteria bacterium]
MRRLRQTFVIASITFAAAGFHTVPANAQEVDPDIAAEELFHRREMLELLQRRMPAAINAKRWQDALMGDDHGVLRPQYIATLFKEYSNLKNQADKSKTIKWVEAIAEELVAGGEGELFLRLAAHYVRHQTVVSFESPFAAQRISFGKNIEDLGKIMAKTLSRMSPDDQRTFKESFATAIAGELVNHCDEEGAQPKCQPNPDFAFAVMGYRLFKDFAGGSGKAASAATADAMVLMREQLGKYSFTAKDLAGFFTRDGLAEFNIVTSSYVTQDQSSLMLLLEMGMRADYKAGESLRHVFMLELKPPGNASLGLVLYNQVYEISQQHDQATLYGTLAQRMTAREWQRAIGFVLSFEQVKGIYQAYYASAGEKAKTLFQAARLRPIAPHEEANMTALFADLLKKTAAKPETYYRLVDDFQHHEPFNRVLMAQGKFTTSQVKTHFDYLAGVYVHTESISKIINTNMRLMNLIRAYPITSQNINQIADGFRSTILKYAEQAGGSREKSHQLAKVVSIANTSGWHECIDNALIGELRKRMDFGAQSDVHKTLDEIQRVNGWFPRIHTPQRLSPWRTYTAPATKPQPR